MNVISQRQFVVAVEPGEGHDRGEPLNAKDERHGRYVEANLTQGVAQDDLRCCIGRRRAWWPWRGCELPLSGGSKEPVPIGPGQHWQLPGGLEDVLQRL